VEC
jgi:trimethyllysine dioxygenase